MMTIKKAMLLYNTIKYLHSEQIIGQILKLFVMKRTYCGNKSFSCKSYPVKTLIPYLDLDTACLSRFNIDEILNNIFTLLSESHHLDLSTWKVHDIKFNMLHLRFPPYT